MKMKILHHTFYLCAFLITALTAFSQNEPILLEAEAGDVGSDFNIVETPGGDYVSITTNGIADGPENANRVITFEVTFPTAQSYDLYIRCRVGSGGFDDDSFFYGNGFGEKSPTAGNEWVRANNLSGIGYTGDNQVVDGGGIATTSVWKWINLSEYTMDETPVIFTVSTDGLTKTFQIGAREDGLDIDKFAFARADYFYTVSNLDNGEPGSPNSGGGGPGTSPIAEGKFKFLGNVFSNSQLPYFNNYWNQVTPENAGKWGSVEATRDNMNWTQLDAAYNLAKDNGYIFKLHVLIWGNQQPGWIASLPPNEQLEEIEEWFQALADRYDDIDVIEVVNEPLHDPPNSSANNGGNYINALGGEGSTGWDWVLESFRLARQYFPGVELMLNDYSIVNSTSNTNDYIEIIELLQDENLIDQIGVQAHAFSTANASVTTMTNNLNALAATGLPIYATELDIDGPTDAVQLSEYQRVFPMFWEHPDVKGVTLWGYRPGMWRTDQGAFLIEEDGSTERPALQWLRMYVEDTILETQDLAPSSDHIRVFPNPVTSNTLTIDGLERIERAEILDASGRILWANDGTLSNTIEINITLASGLYLLRIFDEKYLYSKKLIVR